MKTVAEVYIQEWMRNLTEEERASLDRVMDQVRGFIRTATDTAKAIANAAVREVEQANIGHDRHALLRLYRQRRSWKTADLSRLDTYRLNKAARKRVAALQSLQKYW